MCARYRMVRNPNPTGDKKKQALHPRVVPYGTLHTDEVIKEAESRSGMSGADIKGALRVLADVMVSRLDQGYNIELDGLGFFSVSLTSRPVMDKKEIRSESIHFKNVNFRCGKYLKSKLKTMHPGRKRRSPSFRRTGTPVDGVSEHTPFYHLQRLPQPDRMLQIPGTGRPE